MTTSRLDRVTGSHPPARSPAGPDPDADLAVLEAVGSALRRRGWTARLVVLDVCGEPDVRLSVACAGSPVRLEILGPHPSPPRARDWFAVRITPERRAVWRGPSRRCPPDELVRFLEALGSPGGAEHAGQQVLS